MLMSYKKKTSAFIAGQISMQIKMFMVSVYSYEREQTPKI